MGFIKTGQRGTGATGREQRPGDVNQLALARFLMNKFTGLAVFLYDPLVNV